jgi:MoxR-like ATPase
MSGAAPVQLMGRDEDLVLCSFVDRAATGGGSLLLSGDAGVGKTALPVVRLDRRAPRSLL